MKTKCELCEASEQMFEGPMIRRCKTCDSQTCDACSSYCDADDGEGGFRITSWECKPCFEKAEAAKMQVAEEARKAQSHTDAINQLERA